LQSNGERICVWNLQLLFLSSAAFNANSNSHNNGDESIYSYAMGASNPMLIMPHRSRVFEKVGLMK
jgi:hypothetical protein